MLLLTQEKYLSQRRIRINRFVVKVIRHSSYKYLTIGRKEIHSLSSVGALRNNEVWLKVTRRSRLEQEVQENFGSTAPEVWANSRNEFVVSGVQRFSWNDTAAAISTSFKNRDSIGTTASRHFPLELMYLTNRDAHLPLMHSKW